MDDDPVETDFARFLRSKRRGGVALEVGVSRGIWMGGLHEERTHEPMVFLGPADWEGEEELTFFSSAEAVEALIQQLQAAAKEAWGEDD